MDNVNIIKKNKLFNALKKKYRLYLTGKLQKPQKELNCIEDNIEIGLSYYKKFTADTPHMHPVATEHAIVLKGQVKLLIVDTKQEYLLKKGDFFMLKPNVKYASKNKKGTKVFFIKSPGGNDKTVIDIDNFTKNWLNSWK